MASWRDEKKGDFKLPPAPPVQITESRVESQDHASTPEVSVPTQKPPGESAQLLAPEELTSLKKAFEEQQQKLKALEAVITTTKATDIKHSKAVAETTARPSHHRRGRSLWQYAILILALLISTSLIAYLLKVSEIRRIGDDIKSSQANLKKLQEENKQRRDENNRLNNANKALEQSLVKYTEKQKQIQSGIGDLERKHAQLQAANKELDNQFRSQLERMWRDQTTNVVEMQIIATLRDNQVGMERDEIVKAVKINLPAVGDDFVQTALKNLVTRSQVVNHGRTESRGDYRLKGNDEK